MLTTLLSALCAVVLSAGEITAPVDTLNNYIINGQAVSNFDGSQISGKVVNQYRIIENKVGGHVIKTHYISVFAPNASTDNFLVDTAELGDEKPQIVVRKLNPDAAGILKYIIDDKPATEEQFSKVSPSDIISMEVLKSGGDKNSGVIKIYTKNAK